jgi:hypothetical protein
VSFKSVPALARFERHAVQLPECAITQYAYTTIKQIFADIPLDDPFQKDGNTTQLVNHLQKRCAAVEQATRVLWACAAATDHIVPKMWETPPDFRVAWDYFMGLPDLELMKITDGHRISWELQTTVNPANSGFYQQPLPPNA